MLYISWGVSQYILLMGTWTFVQCSLTFTDINECMEGENKCTNTTCINSHGSYTCRCEEKGHQLSEDGFRCEGKILKNSMYIHVQVYCCASVSRSVTCTFTRSRNTTTYGKLCYSICEVTFREIVLFLLHKVGL